MSKPRQILVVAPHPDDEMLGAAGTIYMHTQAGDEVSILILGQGEMARRTPTAEGAVATQILATAAREAATIVGATLIGIEDLPDNAFDSVPLLDVIQTVEKYVAQVKPDVIYTCHSGDLNIDHQLTCRAVVTGSRAQGGNTPDILSFEVRSATDFAESLPSLLPFRPTVWQALDESAVAAKMAALQAYGREMREWPHSRSYRGLQALLEHRGAQVGVPAAEAFMLLRQVKSRP